MQHDPVPVPEPGPATDTTGDGVELRLIVSTSPSRGWHACVIGPGETRRDFASPFELARFVAWPHAARPGSPRDRLR